MLHTLIEEVALARKNFIAACSGLTSAQASFRPAEDIWSVTDNAEHLVWAEWGGVSSIWKAIDGFLRNEPVWKGEAIHHGLSIEEIIAKTWQPKEKVPPSAGPQWGGPIPFWLNSLANCQLTLNALEKDMEGLDPEKVIYPHPISGPLNVLQRMQFLRFHMERHQGQVERLKQHPAFPLK
jgi:hypothetical protein